MHRHSIENQTEILMSRLLGTNSVSDNMDSSIQVRPCLHNLRNTIVETRDIRGLGEAHKHFIHSRGGNSGVFGAGTNMRAKFTH